MPEPATQLLVRKGAAPMATDLRTLNRNDQVILGAGFLAFIFSFFHFAGKSIYNYNAWNGLGLLGMLLLLLGMGVVAAQVFTTQELPKLPVSWTFVAAAASALGALFIVIKLFTAHVSVAGISADLDIRIGGILLTIAAVVQALFAGMRLLASGEALPWATHGTGTPAPPAA